MSGRLGYVFFESKHSDLDCGKVHHTDYNLQRSLYGIKGIMTIP